MKPSNYTMFPSNSIFRKWEAEMVFANIMVILSRTGDTWRKLTWREYRVERLKDDNFSDKERKYFDQVISYCEEKKIKDIFEKNVRYSLKDKVIRSR